MDNIITNKKLDDFLQELTNISIKYGIEISGCGCCGSPSLSGFHNELFEDGYLYKTCLSYDAKRNLYRVDE